MLDEYENIEPVMYKQMKKCLKTLSHAYLFNLNGNVYAENMIMSFIKNIICGEHKSKEEYDSCDVCRRINNNTYLELKKIYPDGLWIKKDQLDELQKSFSTKAIESEKRVYVIYETEKLNKSAANSLLKFLEEPENNIVAILLTNNINQVISTITSRCQVLTFSKNKVEDYIKHKNINENITLSKILFSVWKITDIDDNNIEYYKLFLDNVIKFIKKYETEGLKMIIHTKSYFHDYFKEKEEILKFFECVILFYTDVFNYKLKESIKYYDDYLNDVIKINSSNTKSQLVNKLNVLIQSEKLIKNNINMNMLIDDVIMDMEGTVC